MNADGKKTEISPSRTGKRLEEKVAIDFEAARSSRCLKIRPRDEFLTRQSKYQRRDRRSFHLRGKLLSRY